MRPITEVANRVMTWAQAKDFKQEYDLVLGDGTQAEPEIVARLIWEKSLGTLAQAQISEGSYTFQRNGFLRPRINVRQLGAEVDLFTFEPQWTLKGIRGELTLPDGTTYFWKHTGSLKMYLTWFDAHEQKIAEFRNSLSWKGQTTTSLEITYPPVETTNLGLLIILGEYANLLTIRDTAAANSAGVI